MFKINRVKAICNTVFEDFGCDFSFERKLNFIASHKNTRGKSSVIEAIFYCLGVEELIGGLNEHVLKPVFRNSLIYGEKEYEVLESKFFLEIQNGNGEIITIQRQGKGGAVKPTLITVFWGKIEELSKKSSLKFEDMYIHSPGAASNQRGFHNFLANFIGWDLPEVPDYDGGFTKLYIQLIFASFFVEQKRGWSSFVNIASNKYGIKDPVKRIVEFVLGLETLKTEKEKINYKIREKVIQNNWSSLNKEIVQHIRTQHYDIMGLPELPQILDESYKSKINVLKILNSEDIINLPEFILASEYELMKLKEMPTIDIKQQSESLEKQLIQVQAECDESERKIDELQTTLREEKDLNKEYLENLQILRSDLQNNKDTRKIKNLGSIEYLSVQRNECPVCHQTISDALLPQEEDIHVMSIEDNIKFLEAQIKVMEYANERSEAVIERLTKQTSILEQELIERRRIFRALKSDLYSPNHNVSESIVRKKIALENKIEQGQEILTFLKERLGQFDKLSNEYKTLLGDKHKIPEDRFTDDDIEKLNYFEKMFVTNLQTYGFSSTKPSKIKISRENFLPEVDGFKLAYDASASDYIRAIWAFDFALMQASLKYNGNHCNVLIFDEPKQHSITPDHAKNFFNSLAEFNGDFEVIVGITLQNTQIENAINAIDSETAQIRYIDDYAVTPL
jgi:hypothetical protein